MTPSREAFPKEPLSRERLPRQELPYGGNRPRSTPRTGSMRGSTDSWEKKSPSTTCTEHWQPSQVNQALPEPGE